MAKKLGIIGLGWFATLIAKSLSEKQSRATVMAGCDVDPDKRKDFKNKFSIEKVYENADDLINDNDVDLVLIATPPFMHAVLGRKALFAGKHVFFEKPGALSPEEMGDLINIARTNGLKTSIDYVMRRNPLYLILKRLCDSGIFGILERAHLENYAHDDHMPSEHWFWDYSKSGGIWVEHGVHFFDIVNWLIGPPKEVRAFNLRRSGKNLIDRVIGFALHKDDVMVSYYHGFTKPETIEKTVFYFTFERAYAEIHGWIPTRLVIDALISPEDEEYLSGKLLNEAKKNLPNIGVNLSKQKVENFGPGGKEFVGKGKIFRATSRVKFEFSLVQDRWVVYRACVLQNTMDLIDAIEGLKPSPDITLVDAKNSLEVACKMEKYAKINQLKHK